MSYASEAEDTRTRWQSQDDLDLLRLSGDLYPLLVESGSLTKRLRSSCRKDFAVQVLRQIRCNPAEYPEHILDPECRQALLREVYLQCDGQPVVFAQTLVPDASLEAHPWLGELGGKPLGHALFARDDVERRPFEFARLGKQDRLSASALAGLDPDQRPELSLWARRSKFMIGGFPVSVNEVFFQPVSAPAG